MPTGWEQQFNQRPSQAPRKPLKPSWEEDGVDSESRLLLLDAGLHSTVPVSALERTHCLSSHASRIFLLTYCCKLERKKVFAMKIASSLTLII